jgi:argininosuccinate synthase
VYKNNPIILAFSGGLDTSFCIPWLQENYNRDIITVTVDTGGLSASDRELLKEKSHKLGACEHVLIDAKEEFFEETVKYLIFGNVKKGNLYPLSVGAERSTQAKKLAAFAIEHGLYTIAHGCTAAGNDQVRFEIILKALLDDIEILAPIRDHNWQRKDQVNYLTKHNMPVPSKGSNYSVNKGLWGVTIGGMETLTSETVIPDDAWALSANALNAPSAKETHTITFKKGVPYELNDKPYKPIEIIEALEELGAKFGIGRGIHLGDTIIGTKGRVAFEAPAAEIIIATHRELEKLTLSGLQLKQKDLLAMFYGDYIHEGKTLDPVCRDIEAFLESSQKHVTGKVSFTLRMGSIFINGSSSKYSLMAASKSTYGEAASEWTARDALGFTNIQSLPGIFQSRVKEK